MRTPGCHGVRRNEQVECHQRERAHLQLCMGIQRRMKILEMWEGSHKLHRAGVEQTISLITISPKSELLSIPYFPTLSCKRARMPQISKQNVVSPAAALRCAEEHSASLKSRLRLRFLNVPSMGKHEQQKRLKRGASDSSKLSPSPRLTAFRATLFRSWCRTASPDAASVLICNLRVVRIFGTVHAFVVQAQCDARKSCLG